MAGSTWTKAPDFAADPARVEAVREQTRADKRNYLESGMQEVQCRTCGACVLARKNSYRHTSIQWLAAPGSVCPELAGASVGGAPQGCPRLHNSIEHAVLEGILEVRDRDA